MPSQPLRLIHDIEELALHAWPAAEVQIVDGWRLRFTHGTTRRANSVWPNDAGQALPLDDKLDLVEEFYTRRGLPPRYQICTAAQPVDLDAVLERRGYVADAFTSVQIADLTGVLAATPGRPTEPIVLGEALNANWFGAYCQAEHVAEHEAEMRRSILERIAPPTAYISLAHEGRTIATGLGVLEHGWVGVFSMTTAQDYRRRGAATAILRALAEWGSDHSARNLYLQVMRHNTPARALYERVGFRTLYEYHYREGRSL